MVRPARSGARFTPSSAYQREDEGVRSAGWSRRSFGAVGLVGVAAAASLLVGACSRREPLNNLQSAANGVALPPGIRQVSVADSASGCSGGCAFLTSSLCTRLGPEEATSSLRSAWERSGASFDVGADRFQVEGHGDGYRITIDADPAGRFHPSPAAVADRTCPDATENLVIVYLTSSGS